MLTTEREIRSKQDRYGSFERRSYEKIADLGLDNDDKEGYNFGNGGSINNIRSVDSTVANGGVTAPVKPEIEKKVGAVITPGAKHLNVSDNYTDKVKRDKKIVAGVAPKDKVRTKNVIMICAYCLVVVALVTVIALNAGAISGLAEKNAVLEGEVTRLSSEYTALSTELAALSDVSRIESLAATTLALTETEATVVEMNVPTMRETSAPILSTNWFDKLCDLVSSVIGG